MKIWHGESSCPAVAFIVSCCLCDEVEVDMIDFKAEWLRARRSQTRKRLLAWVLRFG